MEKVNKMNRKEHMEWCKQRAHEELNRGSVQNAIASMLSDLTKHPETAKSAHIAGMLMLTLDLNNKHSIRKFIDGFN